MFVNERSAKPSNQEINSRQQVTKASTASDYGSETLLFICYSTGISMSLTTYYILPHLGGTLSLLGILY